MTLDELQWVHGLITVVMATRHYSSLLPLPRFNGSTV